MTGANDDGLRQRARAPERDAVRRRAGGALSVLVLLLIGCTSSPDSEEDTMGYPSALRAIAEQTRGAPPAGSDAERRAIARFTALFGEFTPSALEGRVRAVYAEDAFLDDGLKVLRGNAAIERYFVDSAAKVESTQIEFHDWVRSGDDFYLRWTMRLKFTSLARGRVVASEGMSHVRLDADGRVVLHKDFWDSASGLYEHVPILGGLIRLVRSRI